MDMSTLDHHRDKFTNCRLNEQPRCRCLGGEEFLATRPGFLGRVGCWSLVLMGQFSGWSIEIRVGEI